MNKHYNTIDNRKNTDYNKRDNMVRDIDIRKRLKSNDLKRFYKDGSRVVEELALLWGEAIADMVVINGNLHVFEIKSEVDDFTRFEHQFNIYNKIFDFCTLIIHEKHYKKYMEVYHDSLPFWGITTVKKMNGKIESDIKKKPKMNLNTDIYSICHLLWKSEVYEILNDFQIKIKGLSKMNKKELYRVLSENINKNKLSEIVRTKLKSRADWKVA